MIMIVPKVVIAGSGTGDKLPVLIKCSSWRASQIAPDNQVQLLKCSCGTALSPAELLLLTGEGARARQPGKVAHLGEGKP